MFSVQKVAASRSVAAGAFKRSKAPAGTGTRQGGAGYKQYSGERRDGAARARRAGGGVGRGWRSQNCGAGASRRPDWEAQGFMVAQRRRLGLCAARPAR